MQQFLLFLIQIDDMNKLMNSSYVNIERISEEKT